MIAQDVIRRALRIARVLDPDEAMESGAASDALETLNAMLAEWHVAEIGVPDYEVSSLTDEVSSDAADREAIAYQLARRIAGEYGSALLPADEANAAETMSRMRLRYFQPGCVDAALPTSASGYYNIDRD